MKNRLCALGACLLSAFPLGCGASGSEHVEKPMTAPPVRQASAFDKLTTPEEKIRYIESSNAPAREKEQAIKMIESGKM